MFGKKPVTQTGVLGCLQTLVQLLTGLFRAELSEQAGLKHSRLLSQWSDRTAKAGGPAPGACSGAAVLEK